LFVDFDSVYEPPCGFTTKCYISALSSVTAWPTLLTLYLYTQDG
jgi:hypothetical protein